MKIRTSIALVLAGLSIGWLMGLTISPVLQAILTSLVAVTLSIVGVLAGIEKTDEAQSKKAPKVNVLPVTLIVVGVAFGSTAGIYVRTHNYLGVDNNLSSNFPENQTGTEAEINSKLGILFGVSAEYCDLICLKHGEDLRVHMSITDDSRLKALVDSLPTDNLQQLKLYLCKKCQE